MRRALSFAVVVVMAGLLVTALYEYWMIIQLRTELERLRERPISQQEAIVKVRTIMEDVRVDGIKLRPLTEDEIGFIREWFSVTGVDKEPPELIWIANITQLTNAGPKSGVIMLDAYTGEDIYWLLLS